MTFTTKGFVRFSAGTAVDRVAFSVSDTRRRIGAEEMRLIQQPFAQVHGATNRSHSGFGLGLPQARRLLHVPRSGLVSSTDENQGVTASSLANVPPAVTA